MKFVILALSLLSTGPLLLTQVLAVQWRAAAGKRWSVYRPSSAIRQFSAQTDLIGTLRGGSSNDDDDHDDEERYSRQVYTLGARAHGLVRSATIYVDGPSKSGLLYECVKNLALSGIGKIVIVTSKEEKDAAYHYPQLDDLGQTYVRGARAEIGPADDGNTMTNIPDDKLLAEFLYRLNPSLQVETVTREELCNSNGSSGILLCVDRPYTTQIQLNKLCRNRGFPFVSVETAGVYGRTFCDFGPTFDIHDVDGETPLVVPLDRVELSDDSDTILLVRCVSGERHDVSKGDEIQFQLANGDMMDAIYIVTNVKSPELIEVETCALGASPANFISQVNSRAASFSRIKKIEQIAFEPLETVTEAAKENAALFTPCDLDKSYDKDRRSSVFSCFQALDTFVQSTGRLPRIDDGISFLATVKEAWTVTESEDSSLEGVHCRSFLRTCAAKFVPLQAIFGAIGAQECLKAASGLYNPIRQFLLYDCDEVLPSPEGFDHEETDCSATGQGYILGKTVEKALQNQKLFVVGAGAIGCEILKNLAGMGAGTGKRGLIVVTDMDTIERSNLSRQLLFRDSDIGKFKSKAAEEAVHRLNPSLKIECHTSKVGENEHGPFESSFWAKKVDVILNALDNVEARLFMDGRCVANEKALVDAGTLGSKGNVQVVIPHQSESYGSSTDPSDPAIPVCTLKNFPYSISHTIQWGRDLFDGLFVRRPNQANKYADTLSTMGVDQLAGKLEHDLGDQAAAAAANELSEDISIHDTNMSATTLREECIQWAIKLARAMFVEAIESLLAQHPPDSLDEDGEKFWSGSRKVPKPLLFSVGDSVDGHQAVVNKNLIDFVKNTARLRLETFLAPSATSEDSIVTSEEAEAALRRGGATPLMTEGGTSDDNVRSMINRSLQSIASFSGESKLLNVAEFEKDDESNGHVSFIAAASNLRAICYGIAPVDSMETRRVAGRIVPAMITTTAFVSALSCIELTKLVQSLPLKRFRNAFINLALPFFAFTEPLPAEEMGGLKGQTFTLWDRITIKEGKKAASAGGMTLRQLLKRLKRKACDGLESVEISTVSFSQFMIYANFLNEGDDSLLDMNVWDVVQRAVEAGNEFDNEFSRSGEEKASSSSKLQESEFLDLTVIVEDLETGEEVELPPVRIVKSKL